MRDVFLLVEAAEDMLAAHDFYEDIEASLGKDLVDSIVADIRSLSRSHPMHSVQFGCHRKLATYFPFALYYLETEKETIVVGILDLRRNPSWTRKEISRRAK